MSEISLDGGGVKFWLRVKPRARHERLVRTSAGELCLEVLAPPVDQKANDAVIEFLAKSLGVPRSAVEILVGQKSRRKLVRVTREPASDIFARLEALAPRSAD
jgi:uncharacterized protein (TIGR00251 family)